MGYNKASELVYEVRSVANSKKGANNWQTLVLAILGGAYIAIGSILAIEVGGGVPGIAAENPGLQKFLFGAVFPLGLLLIVVAGGELFTGNTSYFVPSVASKEYGFRVPFKNWAIVYIGNFIGAIFVAYFLTYQTGLFKSDPWLSSCIDIAKHKTHNSFWVTMLKGIGCNWLVALAMWKSYAAKDITGKFFAIWMPVMGFVAIGFEHSIANMFFIPTAIFYGADITWSDFIVNNLIPATIGNIIGGAFFVGFLYWFAYEKKKS